MPKVGRRYILSVLFLLFACMVGTIAFYLSQKHRTWSDVTEEKVLRIVTTYGSMNYFVDDGVPKGFNYEIVKAFCDEYGLLPEIIIESDFKRRLRGLYSGEYDIILDLMPATAECKRDMATSAPLLVSRLVLVQRKRDYIENDNDYITDIVALNGRKICILKGSYYRMVLDNLRSELGIDFRVVELDGDIDMLFGMVVRGEIEYVAFDHLSVLTALAYHPSLEAEMPLGFSQLTVWGLSDSGELKSRLDAFIDSISYTPWFVQHRREYFGK